RDGRRPLIERISPDAPASTGGVFPRPTEETDVSPKSIQLPATAQTAILAVERLAKTEILSLGAAAAKLIERGLATDSVPRDAPMPLAIGDVHIDALFDEIRRRCDADEEEADAALGAAVARAEAAEATVAQIRATLGQPG
ncbi:MAG: hypothetical protein OSB00_17175, partial [Sphingomonas bacterium]|nr:hypothetical protein [Sphingomonas bacterium]